MLKGSIIKLRNQGKSVNYIANKLGCSKSTVSYHINIVDLGGDIVRMKKNDEFILSIPKEMINEVINLRKNGVNYKTISNKTKLSNDQIKKICRISNLNINPNEIKFNDNFILKINERYSEIKNLKKVCSEFGVSYYKVKKIIIPNNGRISSEDRKNNIVKSVTKHRQNVKKKLVEYKGGCCVKCGYNKSLAALTFHHINPEEKDFTIGGKNYSWDRMVKEVDKCILVCHNCHAEIHEDERNNK